MSNSDEATFTLDEARRELAREECRRHGHDFQVIEQEIRLGHFRDGPPLEVRCGRCWRRWQIVSSDDEGQPSTCA